MKVFLSHCSIHKFAVREFSNHLPDYVKPWLDENSLAWGTSLKNSLEKAINSEVDFVIVFLGNQTLKSKWVRQELQWALERENALQREFVLPIILEEQVTKSLPTEFAQRLQLRLKGTSSADVKQLANDAVDHLVRLMYKSYEALASDTLNVVLRQAHCGRFDDREFWTRPMLPLPLNVTVVENAMKVLKNAAKVAGQALREVMPKADASKVRANIFLPTSKFIQDGDVCALTIPEIDANQYLQVNMENPDEIRIPFRPNEGATGRVFVRRRAIGVVVNPTWLNGDKAQREQLKYDKWIYVELHPTEDLSEPGTSLYTDSGNNFFNMNDFLERRVDKDLTWIISLPILVSVNGRQEVIGVFNVDCREHWIEPKRVRAIFYRIAPLAGALSGIMKDLPFDRVAIFRVQAKK